MQSRCDRPTFGDASLDRGTLDELVEVIEALSSLSAEASAALHHVQQLRAACDRDGSLPRARRYELGALVAAIEARLQ